MGTHHFFSPVNVPRSRFIMEGKGNHFFVFVFFGCCITRDGSELSHFCLSHQTPTCHSLLVKLDVSGQMAGLLGGTSSSGVTITGLTSTIPRTFRCGPPPSTYYIQEIWSSLYSPPPMGLDGLRDRVLLPPLLPSGPFSILKSRPGVQMQSRRTINSLTNRHVLLVATTTSCGYSCP